MKFIKELRGHSGARVCLYDNQLVVKSGLKNSIECVDALERLPFSTPKIHEVGQHYYIMEYINGDDVSTFLEREGYTAADALLKFIDEYFSWSLKESSPYIFELELKRKVVQIAESINAEKLIDDMLYPMPRGPIHGDLTLDNIIIREGEFFLIDANPTELNSVHFDGAKLRQDLDGRWFMRNYSVRKIGNLLPYCNYMSEHLKAKWTFMNNNSIYSFMLCRILPYCTTELTRNFIEKELRRIWPS